MSFFIKQNDTVPALRAYLRDGDGVGVNLDGATVKFKMRKASDATVVVDASASIITALTGLVQYNWASGDTSTVGFYEAEFEVTYGDSTVETFPNNTYILVEITDDIS